MHSAVAIGNIEIIKLLLQKNGIDIDAEDEILLFMTWIKFFIFIHDYFALFHEKNQLNIRRMLKSLVCLIIDNE